MKLANQPDFLPSNKLTVAAMIGPAVVEVWQVVAHAALAGPAMSALVGSVVALVVGYFVDDRANVPK